MKQKQGALRSDVIKYVLENYNTTAENKWIKYPNYQILRHPNNKWYGAIMDVEKSKLGIEGDEKVDILVVKCDTLMQGSLLNEKGFYPAYHFSKAHWISILLDGTVAKELVYSLIDYSYDVNEKQYQKSLKKKAGC